MSEWILRSQAAQIAGISPDTFSAYVTRGQAPGPVAHVGATPLWDEAQIRAWNQERPGRPGRPVGSRDKHPRPSNRRDDDA